MKTKLKEINLLNDVMFKSLLCHERNREMVVDVIHALTKIDKELLRQANYISGEEILKKNKNNKKQITDVTIRIDNNQKIIVEMNQYKTMNTFEKNSMYAMSRIVESTSKKMNKYPRIILINIDNFNEYKTKRPIIEFKIRDEEGNVENKLYQSIHLILANLNNTQYNINQEIRKFGEFLKVKTIGELEKAYKGDEKYMAAIRTVEELSSDPEFEGYYDYEEAKKQEVIDARLGGIEDEKIEIAKNLIELGVEIEKISKATGLSLEEIESLQK